jgi:hypothetical protein
MKRETGAPKCGGVDLVPAQVVIGAAIGMTSNPLGMALCNGVIQTPSRRASPKACWIPPLLSFFANTSIRVEISAPSAGVRFPPRTSLRISARAATSAIVLLGRLDEARGLVFPSARRDARSPVRHSTCKSSATSSLWRCVSVLAKTDFN